MEGLLFLLLIDVGNQARQGTLVCLISFFYPFACSSCTNKTLKLYNLVKSCNIKKSHRYQIKSCYGAGEIAQWERGLLVAKSDDCT